MIYEPVIGLEVHVELNTKSKMFCRCSADYFGKEPNTHTCPTCLGLPGALPTINEAAIDSCMKIGLALNCKVAEKSLFERKNYFYPDLPKGYQISQYRWPLCVGGWLMVNGKDGVEIKIRINRAHQEEDTAKLVHQCGTQNSKLKTQKETLIDFNRSGVPLVEIVTEPDFKNVEEIRDYGKKLQQMFRYLGVSNADMERGDMRLEANVSVRKAASHSSSGNVTLPNYRVELKNINSFRFMVAAVEFEIKRQITALESGEKLSQETRGWDEDKKCTYLQRSKEDANDYRYFPEPDLPHLTLDNGHLTNLKKQIPQLPWDKAKRYVDELGIKRVDAQILSESIEIANFFEKVVEQGEKQEVKAQDIANYIINKKIDIDKDSPTRLIGEMKVRDVGVITDIGEIERWARQAIEKNPKSVSDYRAGKENAIQSLIGGVMRLSKGKADAGKVKELLKILLI